MRGSLAVAITLLLLAGQETSAQVLTFTDEEFLIVASAAPDTPFIGGVGNTTITIDQSTGDFGGPGSSDGLIRFLDFEVSPLAVVKSATLGFYTTSFTNGPVGAYRMTTDWDSTSTWNTLGGGLTIGVDTAPTALDTIINTEESVVSFFDVTEAVADWVSGDEPNFGFGIRNDSSDGWDVQTVDQEGAPAPFLTVEIEVPSPARLEIDRASGFGRLVSVVDDFDFELRGYEMLGQAGDFEPIGWSQTNLAERAPDTVEGGNAGERWQTVNDATDQLYEAFLLGDGSTISPGGSVDVGRLMAPGAGQAEPDFQATIITSNFLGGSDEFNIFSNTEVRYVDFEGLPGDFNADGRVDAADYTMWRDGNSPDDTQNPADYGTWSVNYGATVPAAEAVPEPTGAVVIVVALGCLATGAWRDAS